MDALDEVGDADVVRGQSEGCADLDEFGFALAEERAGENAVGVLSGCGWMDWARAAGGGGDDVRGICGGGRGRGGLTAWRCAAASGWCGAVWEACAAEAWRGGGDSRRGAE